MDYILLYMSMSKKMILAVFIISVAAGAETKFQIGIVQLCTSTDGAFMLGNCTAPCLRTSLGLHASAELLSSADLLRIVPAQVFRSEIEQDKIQQGCHNRNHHKPGA